MKNPIRDLPLTEIMRPEIALTLQHVLRIYTVGSLLDAPPSPTDHHHPSRLCWWVVKTAYYGRWLELTRRESARRTT